MLHRATTVLLGGALTELAFVDEEVRLRRSGAIGSTGEVGALGNRCKRTRRAVI